MDKKLTRAEKAELELRRDLNRIYDKYIDLQAQYVELQRLYNALREFIETEKPPD